MINSKFLAFSLIELMVVIAIVGILAVVGSAAYKDYAVSVRMSTVSGNVKFLMNQAKLFIMQKDIFQAPTS
jgi:prepilin-type N-terminal cleavage/methylation domain-containing protein